MVEKFRQTLRNCRDRLTRLTSGRDDAGTTIGTLFAVMASQHTSIRRVTSVPLKKRAGSFLRASTPYYPVQHGGCVKRLHLQNTINLSNILARRLILQMLEFRGLQYIICMVHIHSFTQSLTSVSDFEQL